MATKKQKSSKAKVKVSALSKSRKTLGKEDMKTVRGGTAISAGGFVMDTAIKNQPEIKNQAMVKY